MTQGTSGSFSINGVELLLQPTEHNWMKQESFGYSGEARPTYPKVRKYELTWGLMSMEEFSQLQEFYRYSENTGTVVVDLPKYATSPYQFYSYSGCSLEEPSAGKFFETYVADVSLLILKIKTD